ncbi:MAG: SWIM zinc finger family protein [Acidobacteriia bacterium]|nr:SWIM zinc finger family protein [Terriglobia bacterium]
MARRSPKRGNRRLPPAGADAALLSADLERWAGERVARSGRETALMGKVQSLRLGPDGRFLEARVRDSGPTPYRVEVAATGGLLVSRCNCPFDWGPVCKHAVAAVEALRFPRFALATRSKTIRGGKRGGRIARGRGRIVTPAPLASGTLVAGVADWAPIAEERIALERHEEIAARRKRARRERASVRRISGKGGPPRFLVTGREPEAPYTVVLRGAKGDLASCTCPDFAKNELGICKHVERARGWFSRKRKRFPARVLSVWWQPREWPLGPPDPLRELRADVPAGALPDDIATHFGSDGWLREPPPGTQPVEWARAAVEAARSAAAGRGLVLDLDPAVQARIREAGDGEATGARLATATRGSAIWSDTIPALGFRLHPYQEDGVEFLARRGRAFLADDMGLGKTVQAVAAALLLRKAAGAARALVVCPASLKHQWQGEIERACGERASVVDGSRASRLVTYRGWDRGFQILNYELVLRDLEAIRSAHPDLVILDEAQRIKNWETKTAKAVKRLDSPYAFILTGTPLENRLGELHSLVEFLHPRALGPRWRLIPLHVVTDATGRVVAYEGLDLLRRRLAGLFVRRERKEVLDQLPPRIDHTFWTGMTPEQWRPYRREAARVAALVGKNRPLKPSEVRVLLQALTSMRILCNALGQYAWDRTARRLAASRIATRDDVRAIQSPKLEEFVRVLEDLLDQSDAKVVIFSQWERMLRLGHFVVRDLLERRGERAEMFHGGLDAGARTRVLEAFRTDPDLRVLFSTDAGGLGLNLQDAASIVVNLEVPWNPAVLEQRISRVHRLGQRASVQVLHFVTRGAIEERVRRVIEGKRALFEGLLVDEADRIDLDEGGQVSFVERIRSLTDDDEPPPGRLAVSP